MNIELFSEIYNCYYQVVSRILENASKNPISINDMNLLAEHYGYGETALTIIPKLISGEWNLLESRDAGYHAKVSPSARILLTDTQKSWLKAILQDPRILLFLSKEEIGAVHHFLSDIQPLFSMKDFLYFDQYSDGDPVSSISYRTHFREILKGIKTKQVLEITYLSGKKHLISHTCLPCRIEYSQKEDKFRLLFLNLREGQPRHIEFINLARICRIQSMNQWIYEEICLQTYLEESLCQEPVVIEISNERNALERTMLHFSSYEKRTEKLGSTGKHLCSIYYSTNQESELLIQILSFGPVINVLRPDRFLHQIKKRIRLQMNLLDAEGMPSVSDVRM